MDMERGKEMSNLQESCIALGLLQKTIKGLQVDIEEEKANIIKAITPMLIEAYRDWEIILDEKVMVVNFDKFTLAEMRVDAVFNDTFYVREDYSRVHKFCKKPPFRNVKRVKANQIALPMFFYEKIEHHFKFFDKHLESGMIEGSAQNE